MLTKIYPHPVQPGTTNVFSVVELITPDRAAQMLASSPGNRRATRVDVYAKQMTEGNWALVPDHIGIDEDGRLLNGHNRLNAVIKAGKNVMMQVDYNIKRSDMAKIDVGKSRSAGEMLVFLFGLGNYYLVASMVRLLVAYYQKNGNKFSANDCRLVTNQNIIDFVSENMEEIAGLDYSHRMPFSPGAVHAANFILNRVDDAASQDFFDQLRKRINPYDGYPIRTLEKNLSNMAYRSDTSRIEAVAKTIKAWNFWRQGKTCKSLKWLDSEPFPRPI